MTERAFNIRSILLCYGMRTDNNVHLNVPVCANAFQHLKNKNKNIRVRETCNNSIGKKEIATYFGPECTSAMARDVAL